MPELIKLTIEGKEVTVQKGRTILEAALKLGIIIPTFCWDPRLKPIGACRMCLVEIEKASKLAVSCSMPALDGMVVKVFSEKAIQGRKSVLEFILSNHPLDCPTCDKGGECLLQDHTFNYGPEKTRTIESRNRIALDPKYVFDDVRLGPVIWLNANRCIKCYKCTRIIKEIAGDDDLGAFNRGYKTLINRHKKKPFRSEFSGNTVENCPVGALVADSFRYRVRSWLLKKTPSVCHLCGDGCNTTLWHQGQTLFRIYSRWNRSVDDGLICDRGRFGGLYADSNRRLKNPKIRKEGKLVDATWDEALDFISRKVLDTKDKYGGNSIGIIGNEMLSNEEAYLLGRMGRQILETDNIDFRFEDRFTPSPQLLRKILSLLPNRVHFNKFDRYPNILILGTDSEARHPVMTLWVKKAIFAGDSRCFAAYHRKTDYTLHPVESIEYFPQGEYNFLLALYTALKGNDDIEEMAMSAGVASSLIKNWAEKLRSEKTLILIGEDLYNNPRGGKNIDLVIAIKNLLSEDSRINILFDGSNYLGNIIWGMMTGILPGGVLNNEENRKTIFEKWGLDSHPETYELNTNGIIDSSIEGNIKALLLFGADIVSFYPDRKKVEKAIKTADFKISCETFLTETGKLCDVVLPLAAFPEREGSMISTEGRLQYFEKAYDPAYSSAEGWKIILRLAQRLGLENDYSSPADIWAEMTSLFDTFANIVYKGMKFGGLMVNFDFEGESFGDVGTFKPLSPPAPSGEYPLILTYGSSVYQKRYLTYYAESMNKIDPGPRLYLNPDNAEKMGLLENDTIRVSSPYGNLTMKISTNSNVRPGTVYLPVNFIEAEFNSLLSTESELVYVKLEKL